VVAHGCTEEELESKAGDRLKPMWDDGCVKVLAGMTTLDELREVAVRKD
jgi:type IV pilus assembly protein PilB